MLRAMSWEGPTILCMYMGLFHIAFRTVRHPCPGTPLPATLFDNSESFPVKSLPELPCLYQACPGLLRFRYQACPVMLRVRGAFSHCILRCRCTRDQPHPRPPNP